MFNDQVGSKQRRGETRFLPCYAEGPSRGDMEYFHTSNFIRHTLDSILHTLLHTNTSFTIFIYWDIMQWTTSDSLPDWGRRIPTAADVAEDDGVEQLWGDEELDLGDVDEMWFQVKKNSSKHPPPQTIPKYAHTTLHN